MCCERLEGVGSWRLRRRPGRQWPCGRLAGWTLGPDSLSRAGGRVMMCSATALTCATTPTPRMTPDPLWITYSFKSEECRRRAADNRPRPVQTARPECHHSLPTPRICTGRPPDPQSSSRIRKRQATLYKPRPACRYTAALIAP
ncbi:uncharacterized protein LOC113202757 isoform X2 [Frankliniella occidentalis]|uniref:Uncharacterized protein LOC113202757 isoform X2 n=1 Tax=Frankliniella occidentalis TaxID=133901 RepID=A0A9C6U9C0_FRAOC|nr:uncharacterized protein LOC113202757 isoform X2 [Frankliniella occidentalis]